MDYSVDELHACGSALVSEFGCARCTRGPDATKAVKQFFARTAGPGVVVLGCNPWGELMVDQCHVTYPPRLEGQHRIGFWDSILRQPLIMRLAVESEWGKTGNLNESLVLMLDDAQKLALMRAEAKALVFASCRDADRAKFVDRVAALRTASHDMSPWLWIDYPWNMVEDHPPAFGVLAERPFAQ